MNTRRQLLAVTGVLLLLGCSREYPRTEVAVKVEPTTEPTNRLIYELSPYLLQHARNPVDWYPWGQEALDKARGDDKPIFLSIGYSACHWCHVMERESFEDGAIAAQLNRDFVAIKVDREERPDLDEIYMTAVQMMTGSGGWPLSVFLTPELKPFFGGTYFPPEDRFGRPGFKTVLEHIAVAWRERRDQVVTSADEIRTALQKLSAGRASGNVTAAPMEGAVEALTRSFDARWGGFGGAPKFPPSGAIGVLLRRYAATGDRKLLRMATVTLDRMAFGGMYDQIGGGFHRYSVDEQWLVPHFEKMLYDNALLTGAYLEAYQLTQSPVYARIAGETLDYVIREMTDASGGFYSSQDADSEGEEGKYYLWNRDDIEEVLGEPDAELFCSYYGISKHGNFEGRNILHIPGSPADSAREAGLAGEELEKRLAGYRERLLDVRAGRVPPGKDDKILTAWNGMMISAFARGFQVLGEERFRKAGEDAAHFILARMTEDDELFRVHRDGRRKFAGYLDDYANLANALVDLYETTFNPEWLDGAERFARKMIELFWDENNHGFFFTSARHRDLLVRTKPFTDGSVPSGNAVAAYLLQRLWKFTGEKSYADKAEDILETVAESMDAYPRAHTRMLLALDFYVSGSREIAVIGRLDAEDSQRMLSVVRGTFMPNKIVAFLDPDARDAAELADRIPLLKGRPSAGGRATTYVCEDFACRKPMTDPVELATFLRVPAGNETKAAGDL